MKPEATMPMGAKKIEDYEVDSACDTLMRAEEIKHNEELMKLVRKKLAKKQKAINSIADLKAAREEMLEQEG